MCQGTVRLCLPNTWCHVRCCRRHCNWEPRFSSKTNYLSGLQLQLGTLPLMTFFFQVVDLLIAMANAACRSSRREIIFDPYPTVVDPLNPTELALNPKVIFWLFIATLENLPHQARCPNQPAIVMLLPHQHKNYGKVEKAMDAFIDMKDMTRMVADLKKRMDATDRLAYPLLQWSVFNCCATVLFVVWDDVGLACSWCCLTCVWLESFCTGA